MIRPLTCLSLAAALGAGLYLYQEKHRAQLLDREITRTVKQADAARDRIGLLRAEWALLNEPERLAALASQHLQSLQSLQPAQFARLEDLRSRLPPIAVPPPPAPAALDQPLVAALVPAAPARTQLAAAPVAAALAAAAPAVVVAAPVRPASKPSAVPVQLAAAPMAHPAAREAPRHALFAPVMPAFAPTPVLVHAPTVQTASAMAPASPAFVGSALGMGRTVLAAPVPYGATGAGYPPGR